MAATATTTTTTREFRSSSVVVDERGGMEGRGRDLASPRRRAGGGPGPESAEASVAWGAAEGADERTIDLICAFEAGSILSSHRASFCCARAASLALSRFFS